MFNNCFLHSKKDMERCTDNRSTTPPLNSKYIEPKLRENGKTIVSSLYDKDDEIDISQTSIANDTLHVSITPHSSKLRFELFNYYLILQSKKFGNDNFQSKKKFKFLIEKIIAIPQIFQSFCIIKFYDLCSILNPF